MDNWKRKSPAGTKAIQKLIMESEAELPTEYLTLLAYSNGGEGEISCQPGWFQLWSAEEVTKLNKDYEVPIGFFGFGSSGGGEMLALDIRDKRPWPIVMISFLPMQAENAIVIADDFSVFLPG